MSRRAAIAVASALAAFAAAALPLGLRLTAQHAAAQRSAEKDPADVALAMTEAEAYAAFAPDTAIVIDLDLLGTNTVTFTPASMGGKNQFQVYWGDGSYTNGHAGYWNGYDYTHTYAKRGRYVLRFPPTVSAPWTSQKERAWTAGCIRVLRWGDNLTFGLNCTSISGAKNLKGPIPRWPTNERATQFYHTYSDCTSLTGSIPAWPSGLTLASSTYFGCTSLTGSIPAWPTNAAFASANYTYFGCTSLTGSIPAWPTNAAFASADYTYTGCTSLTGSIPAWPTNAAFASANATYNGCTSLTGAWTDDPDELMPTNITKHSYTVGGASDALLALFYSDWGGSKERPTE